MHVPQSTKQPIDTHRARRLDAGLHPIRFPNLHHEGAVTIFVSNQKPALCNYFEINHTSPLMCRFAQPIFTQEFIVDFKNAGYSERGR